MTDELTVAEYSKLETYEGIIEAGFETFIAVGSSLMAINDEKLYRQAHDTFEAYCKHRWGMSRQRAYQLMSSVKVVDNLSTIVDKVPETESQARPLTQLEPEQQIEAWQDVLEATEAEGVNVTAAIVEKAANKYMHTKKMAHVGRSNGKNEWYTPPEYIAAAKSVMGSIDLDPASSDMANKIVGAEKYHTDTEENDGLAWDWRGNVFMNPPYSQPLIKNFCEKLANDWDEGFIEQAITLTNNATETKWFKVLSSRCSAICLPAGRIKFVDENLDGVGAPLQGQVIMYFGNQINVFADRFSKFGDIFYAKKR